MDESKRKLISNNEKEIKRMKFKNLKEHIQHCCLTISGCGKCDDGNCCINYSKQAINLYEKKRLRLIPNGIANIPKFDIKIYEKPVAVSTIVECLLLCKECNHNHMQDCVINVVRSSTERILFGDNVDDYKGSVLQHVMELNKIHPEIGTSIMNCYKQIKKR